MHGHGDPYLQNYIGICHIYKGNYRFPSKILSYLKCKVMVVMASQDQNNWSMIISAHIALCAYEYMAIDWMDTRSTAWYIESFLELSKALISGSRLSIIWRNFTKTEGVALEHTDHKVLCDERYGRKVWLVPRKSITQLKCPKTCNSHWHAILGSYISSQ